MEDRVAGATFIAFVTLIVVVIFSESATAGVVLAAIAWPIGYAVSGQLVAQQAVATTTYVPSARAYIPIPVRKHVFRRDGGRCQACGTDFDIQYDHIIPVKLGGSSNVENLQLLCGACNRRKAARLG